MQNGTNGQIRSIHDSLIKKVFRIPEEAAGLLKTNLPQEIVQQVDWTSLQFIDRSFVDEEFKRQESDLVFQAKLKQSNESIGFYFLFEHQSTPDKWLRFRLYKYLGGLWDHFIDQFQKSESAQESQTSLTGVTSENSNRKMPEELISIAPIVFYQGKRNWPYPAAFEDLVDSRGRSAIWTPSFSHILIDQSAWGAEKFKGELKGKVVQLLMKMAFHDPIEQELRLLARWLGIIDLQTKNQAGTDWIKLFLTYFISTQQETDIEYVVDSIEKEKDHAEVGRKIMTLYEQAILKGKTEGKIEGEIEGELKTLKNLYSQGILPEDVYQAQVPMLEKKLQELQDKALSK